MNLQHLKYIVEVARVGSVTKAASNLFMGQPNLSKAIKDVENELGIPIFKRSARGVVPTEKGAQFLEYARAIIVQFDKIEELYKPENSDCIMFNIIVPRASYVCHAFSLFVSKLDKEKNLNLNFKETNSAQAVESVNDGMYNMAIIRYEEDYEDYFLSLINEKGLKYEMVLKFDYSVLISKENPLTGYDIIPAEKLKNMTEIIHGDYSVPYLSEKYINQKEENARSGRRIYVYERGSQFDLLKTVPESFMWVSPMPEEMLANSGLVTKKTDGELKKYKDILIYRASYKMTETDCKFLDELYNVRDDVAGK